MQRHPQSHSLQECNDGEKLANQFVNRKPRPTCHSRHCVCATYFFSSPGGPASRYQMKKSHFPLEVLHGVPVAPQDHSQPLPACLPVLTVPYKEVYCSEIVRARIQYLSDSFVNQEKIEKNLLYTAVPLKRNRLGR